MTIWSLAEAALDPACSLMLCWALALILAQSALHKARDMSGFRASVADFRLLPQRALHVVAGSIVACEGLLILGLLAAPLAADARAPLATALLLLLYTSAIAINLARGRRQFDCGCTGPGARRPIAGDLIVRNSILIMLALVSSLPSLPRALVWLDFLSAAAGALVISVLYAASETALASAARIRGQARANAESAASQNPATLRPVTQWSAIP